jgi:ribose 1,5-bisphosphokinase
MTAPPPVGPGWLVLVVGPSGAGKDTLLAEARQRLGHDPGVAFPARVITRPPDATEQCIAASAEAYEAGCREGADALHWRAHGLGYAIPAAVDAAIRDGRTVVLNVSRTVIPQARALYARVHVVLIDADPAVRAARLAGRGRETGPAIADRLAREAALPSGTVPDTVIRNDGPPDEGGAALARLIEGLGRG